MSEVKDLITDSNLSMFIIDVLRHDVEQINSIVKMLNNTGCIGWREFWNHDFTSKEVVDALEYLLEEKMVNLLVYDESKCSLIHSKKNILIKDAPDDYWFELTKKGHHVWDKWEPPK